MANSLYNVNKVVTELDNDGWYIVEEDGGYIHEQYYSNIEDVPENAEKITFGKDYISKTKGSIDVRNLGPKQIVFSEYKFKTYFNLNTDEEVQAKLNEGVSITICFEYSDDVIETYDIVALANNKMLRYEIGFSERDYKDFVSGCDYVFTRLKGTREDRTIVKELASTKQNGSGFELEFQATRTLNSFVDTIESMSRVFLYVGLGFALFAGFMLMNFISTSISFKRREIGVLRAIGAGKKDVFNIFFSESFVIAVINFILATVATFVIAYITNRSLYQDLGFTITLLTVGVRQIVLLFSVSVGVAFIATLLPVWKIARKNPIDSINNR